MLKQRIITAVVLLILVVLLVLLAPAWLFALVAGLMVLVGIWEWLRLSGSKILTDKIVKTGFVAVLLCLLWVFQKNILITCIVIFSAMLWWLFAFIWVFFWQIQFHKSIKFICGLLTLIPAWVALVALHASPHGPKNLLFLLALVWAADIGAYCAGKGFGKHKLAPKVSPGKTWEGVAGGTVALLAISVLGVMLVLPTRGYLLIFICLFSGWLSVVGDLSESLFKRQAGVKDSGRLFPGHGGMLDRVDSLTAALPAFWLGLALQEWLR